MALQLGPHVTNARSVNWSKTSITMNREAGAIFEAEVNPFLNYTTSVFDLDWNQAYKLVIGQTYTSAQVRIICAPPHDGQYHTSPSLPSSLTSLKSK